MRTNPWPERAAWATLVVVLLVPIWWGGDGRYPWDNSIAPAAVLKALAAHFSPGFFMTYGPMPYYLTAAPYAAVLGVAKIVGELGIPSSTYPWGFRHPEFMMTLLSTVAHLVTMALGIGIVWMAATRDPSRFVARRWLVPLLFLGSPIFAYYACTSNVDVHYLFWLWLGVTLIEQAHGSRRMLGAAAAAAALAVCSKEQSGPVAAVIVSGAMWKAWQAASGGFARRLTPAFVVAAIALLTYALAWRLPWNLEGWRVHHEFIFADATYDRTFPATLIGFLGLAGRVARQTLTVLGLPMACGVLLSVVFRTNWHGLGLRIFACIVYLAGFIGAIGYTYERFLLPLLLVGVPVAIRGWDAALTQFDRRIAWKLAVAVLLVTALTGGPALSWVQLRDPRYAAERWVRERVPQEATVEVAGNPHYQPRLEATRIIVNTKADSLERVPRAPIGDIVLVSSIDAWSFTGSPQARSVWWEPLHDETAGSDYTERVVFSRSWLYAFTPSIEVPTITAYVRDGVRLQGPR